MAVYPKIEPTAPSGETITEYDLRHMLTYLVLVGEARDKRPWIETAQAILGCDVAADLAGARRCYLSHLGRGRWVMEAGFDRYLAALTRRIRAELESPG